MVPLKRTGSLGKLEFGCPHCHTVCSYVEGPPCLRTCLLFILGAPSPGPVYPTKGLTGHLLNLPEPALGRKELREGERGSEHSFST